MKLSIITINYNNKAGLEKTIASVMSQTWRDFEWLIIDGGSTDGSKDVIEELAKNPTANISYWCSEKDKGIYNAMNKGIANSRGEYLNFMNSGDCFYEPDTLDKVFTSQIDDDVIYGQVYFRRGDGTLKYYEYTTKASVESYLNHQFINHQAAYIKRKWCVMHNYDETFKVSADTEFFMYILVHGAHFTCINEPLAIYEVGGFSSGNINQSLDEQIAIIKNVSEAYFPKPFNTIAYCYRKLIYKHKVINILRVIVKMFRYIG